MSDHYISILPTDPFLVPSGDRQQAALAYAKEIAPKADGISLEVYAKPQFFDAGENFSSATCPETGTELDMEWWSDTMDADYDGEGFRMRKYPSPCGGKDLSVNEIDYDWPQGFARFIVQVRNADIIQLDPKSVAKFARLLGTDVKVVYTHY